MSKAELCASVELGVDRAHCGSGSGRWMTRLIALLRVNSLRGRRVPGFLHNGSHLKYDQFEPHIEPLLQTRSTKCKQSMHSIRCFCRPLCYHVVISLPPNSVLCAQCLQEWTICMLAAPGHVCRAPEEHCHIVITVPT